MPSALDGEDQRIDKLTSTKRVEAHLIFQTDPGESRNCVGKWLKLTLGQAERHFVD